MGVVSSLGQSHSMQLGTGRGEEKKGKKDEERETKERSGEETVMGRRKLPERRKERDEQKAPQDPDFRTLEIS